MLLNNHNRRFLLIASCVLLLFGLTELHAEATYDETTRWTQILDALTKIENGYTKEKVLALLGPQSRPEIARNMLIYTTSPEAKLKGKQAYPIIIGLDDNDKVRGIHRVKSISHILPVDLSLEWLMSKSDIIVVGKVNGRKIGENETQRYEVQVNDVLKGLKNNREVIVQLNSSHLDSQATSLLSAEKTYLFFLRKNKEAYTLTQPERLGTFGGTGPYMSKGIYKVLVDGKWKRMSMTQMTEVLRLKTKPTTEAFLNEDN